jgi:predicted alpha-1,6-mannanase (GH76 family)
MTHSKNSKSNYFNPFVLLMISFQFINCAGKADEPFIPSLPVAVTYTSQDATNAYNSFNQYLFDPVRKLYFRDSGQPTNVGAIWTQAIYWDMAMNAYKRTKTPESLQFIEDIYEGCGNYYAQYDWVNQPKVWFIYDDIMWWVISMARAYEITGDQKYLDHSVSGFNRVWSGSPGIDTGSYDPVNGGMYWDWTPGDNGKMSCINYPTVIAAMTLFNITKDSTYFNKATKIYKWAHDNLFDSQLGRVADSRHGSSNDWTLHVYNQATCIGAAVMMFKATNDSTYLHDAVLTANYTENVMCDTNGILPFETGEEQGVYTAILAQYMIRLIDDCNKPEYLPWLRNNINTGWGNRDVTRGLTTKDYVISCPATGVISCYDASGIVALMQVIPPLK